MSPQSLAVAALLLAACTQEPRQTACGDADDAGVRACGADETCRPGSYCTRDCDVDDDCAPFYGPAARCFASAWCATTCAVSSECPSTLPRCAGVAPDRYCLPER